MVARLKTLGNDLVPKAASPVAQQRFYPNLSSSRHYEQTHGGVPHGLNLGISLGQLFKAVQTDLSQIPEHHLYGRVTAVQGMLIEVGGVHRDADGRRPLSRPKAVRSPIAVRGRGVSEWTCPTTALWTTGGDWARLQGRDREPRTGDSSNPGLVGESGERLG